MANACLNSYSSSSSSSTLVCKNRPTDRFSIPSSSSSLGFPFSSPLHCALASSLFVSQNKRKVLRILAITKEEVPVSDVAATTTTIPPAPVEEPAEGESEKFKPPKAKTCELYVCNIPRSCDLAELAQIFKPYGTVYSVKVSRNLETGISKGCGYVIMCTRAECKAAKSALDGTDVGGREMRVRFSHQLSKTNKKRIKDSPSSDADSFSAKKKRYTYETPHRIFVGNLPWSVTPEDLRVHFSQFGTVVSTRFVFDRKGEINRVFAFLSFSKAEESEAAVATSGSVDFQGRKLEARASISETSET